MTYLQKNPASPAPMHPFFRAPSGFTIPSGSASACCACVRVDHPLLLHLRDHEVAPVQGGLRVP